MNNTDYYKKDFKFVPEMLIIAFPLILMILFCFCLAINDIKKCCCKKDNHNIPLKDLRIQEDIRSYSISSNESITSFSI